MKVYNNKKDSFTVLVCTDPITIKTNGLEHHFKFNNLYKIFISKDGQAFGGNRKDSKWCVKIGDTTKLCNITELMGSHFGMLPMNGAEMLKDKKRQDTLLFNDWMFRCLCELTDTEMSNAQLGMQLRDFTKEAAENEKAK